MFVWMGVYMSEISFSYMYINFQDIMGRMTAYYYCILYTLSKVWSLSLFPFFFPDGSGERQPEGAPPSL